MLTERRKIWDFGKQQEELRNLLLVTQCHKLQMLMREDQERKEFREQADQYRKCARKVNNINSMSDLFDSENSNDDMA